MLGIFDPNHEIKALLVQRKWNWKKKKRPGGGGCGVVSQNFVEKKRRKTIYII